MVNYVATLDSAPFVVPAILAAGDTLSAGPHYHVTLDLSQDPTGYAITYLGDRSGTVATPGFSVPFSGFALLRGSGGDDAVTLDSAAGGGLAFFEVRGSAGDDTYLAKAAWAGLTLDYGTEPGGVVITLDGAPGTLHATVVKPDGTDSIAAATGLLHGWTITLGSSQDDTVYAADEAATGQDITYNGGGGTDTLSFANVGSSGVWVQLDLGDFDRFTNNHTWGEYYYGFSNLVGTQFDDTLTGTAAGGEISGLGGNNILTGLDGNDTFLGSDGNDSIDGGGGTNTVSYAALGVAIQISDDPGGGGPFTATDENGKSDTLTNVQVFIGTSQDDIFTIHDPSLVNGDTLDAGVGRDTLFLGDSEAGWTLRPTGDGLLALQKAGLVIAVKGFETYQFEDGVYTPGSIPAPGDLNGDRHPDMLFTNAGPHAGQVWAWVLAPDGGVAGQGLVGSYDSASWQVLASGSANDHAELFLREIATGDVQAWQLNGTDLVTQGRTGATAAAGWTEVGTADSNLDRATDLFFQDSASGALRVLLSSTFAAPGFGGGVVDTSHPPGALGSLSAQDITGVEGLDSSWSVVGVASNNRPLGGAELALYQASSQTIAVWNLQGTAATLDYTQSLDTAGTGAPGVHWAFAAFADLDGDGTEDLLFRATPGSALPDGTDVSGLVYAWLMASDGQSVASQGAPGNPDPSWMLAQVGDFDADGRDDLVWQHADGRQYVWHMDGTGIASQGAVGFGYLDPTAGWTLLGLPAAGMPL